MTKAAAKPETFAATKPAGRPKTTVNPKAPTAGSGATRKQEVVVHKPQPPAAPKSDIALMIEAIRDPKFDPAKAKALCDLRDHEEDRALQRQKLQAEIDFNDALAAVKKQLPPVVGADRKGDKNNKYATLEKVSRTMDRFIHENGFTLSYGMAESSLPDHYRVTAKLSRGLHSRDYFADFPAGAHKSPQGKELMTPAQGIGVLISYARRYLKLMIFDVVVGNEDADGAAPIERISEEQATELKQLCADKGIDLSMFQQAFGVDQVEDLPAIRFRDVQARLKTAPKQQKPAMAEEQ